jgi:hypothetical protein
MVSMPLIAESAGQDQSVQKAPLLIKPVEPSDLVLVPPKQDPVNSVIEAEKKDDNL